MAAMMSTKMKRKDLEEVYDEFSEFSLSSPARKIRRLDADLPPIMEEEESAVPLFFQQPILNEQISSSVLGSGSMMAEPVSDITSNEELALVLYKPVTDPLVWSASSPNVAFKVDSDILSGLKNRVFWKGNRNPIAMEEAPMDVRPAAVDNSLAVVPWQAPVTAHYAGDNAGLKGEMLVEPMDAEPLDGTSMDVEEDEYAATAGVGGEGLHPWPQHCLTPQVPPNTSTPITWSWR